MVTDIACGNPGAITITAAGGEGELTYAWATGQTGPTLSNITSAGDYVVSITDGVGCVTRDTFTVRSAADLRITTDSTPRQL